MQRIVYVAESARLASALLEGAKTLTEHSGSDSLTLAAIGTAASALRSHDSEWRQSADSLGWYVIPDKMPFRYAGRDQPWPLNMQALAGVALEEVGEAIGDSQMLHHARMIYRFVEHGVLSTVRPDGHWDYWPDAPKGYPHHPDDIGHASFTAEVLVLGERYQPPRWAPVRTAVEANFRTFYPDSLAPGPGARADAFAPFASDFARWVEWVPHSGRVRATATALGSSPGLWANAETYLFCSSLGYFGYAPSLSDPRK